MPPCSRWSTRLGILFSPRAIGSPPPPRRMRRAAGQPGRPPAGRQGLPDRTGSWGRVADHHMPRVTGGLATAAKDCFKRYSTEYSSLAADLSDVARARRRQPCHAGCCGCPGVPPMREPSRAHRADRGPAREPPHPEPSRLADGGARCPSGAVLAVADRAINYSMSEREFTS